MDEADLAAVSQQLEVGRVISAYRAGLFPMGLGRLGAPPCGWWSPKRRGVLLPGRLRVTKSLRKSMRRMSTTIDRDFSAVLAACAGEDRPGGWISPEFADVYGQLARRGWAHSVEVWDSAGELIGGLYGLAIGRVFAGESMFHRRTDASKAALVALVEHLEKRCGDAWLIDAQWPTAHLESLGVSEMSELEYAKAVDLLMRNKNCQAFPIQ